MTNRVGQRLGNYRMIRMLGQGGFAEVYLAEHVFLRTQAAIKVLQVRLAYDEMENFLNEARTIAGLSHPNILRVLEFGVEEDLPFLVMEYAPNGTLRQRHRKGSILPLTVISSYVKQITAALQYLHSKKLIHRDIKPENLLIGHSGEILLSDFGTALVVETLHNQSTLEMAGTVTYMAPEQILGKPRPASDQYGLAVVIYEWLCGKPPFTGSFSELSSQHMLASPPSMRSIVPTIPYDVEQVVMMGLAKEPERRFGSVLAFANALEQASQPQSWYGPPGNLYTSPTFTPSFNSSSTEREPPTIGRSISEPTSTIVSSQGTGEESRTVVSGPFSAQAPVTFAPILPQPEAQKERHYSRRAVVLGLLGLGGVVAAGGLGAWVVLQKRGPASATYSTPTPAKTLVGTTLVTYKGHDRFVFTVAWMPKGQHIASGGADNKVQVWNPTQPDGTTLFTYLEHSGSVNSLSWSPDGQRIASASSDKTAQAWDALSGSNPVIYRRHSNWVRTVAWSPDGQNIASGGDDATVQVWEAATGNTLFIYRHHVGLVWVAAWSPAGKLIASGGNDKTVQVWDATTGNILVTFHGHSAPVKALAWSPDGQRIASGGDDNKVRVWDANTGNLLVTYTDHSGSVYSVAWSPDGRRIASGSWGEVRLWNPVAPAGKTLNTYSDQVGALHALAWSPDGQRIASGADDKTVQVWQAS